MKKILVLILLFTVSVGKTQVFKSPKNTQILIVGVLEWKEDLASFSKKNRKDKALHNFFLKQGVPASNITNIR